MADAARRSHALCGASPLQKVRKDWVTHAQSLTTGNIALASKTSSDLLPAVRHLAGMRNPNPKAVAIGTRIRQARNKIGMSGPTLAGMIGVTSGAITQYESGRNAPALKRLERIAEVLGVGAKWLLTGDEPEENVRAQTMNEAEALDLIRRLPARRQATAIKQLRAMVEEAETPAD